jgi:hypothetical protein
MPVQTDISIIDRVGNGIVAGFIATLALSALHETVSLLTAALGLRTPTTGWLFHFFVGTFLWGALFGFLHDYLFGPSWVRGITFAAAASFVVMVAVMPLTGAGFFCIKLGIFAPILVTLFHLIYGAMLGAVYGKLIDTDERHAVGAPQ